ncbi:MAG: oligosaccharide flippase family protein [Planctomycetota bacterium]
MPQRSQHLADTTVDAWQHATGLLVPTLAYESPDDVAAEREEQHRPTNIRKQAVSGGAWTIGSYLLLNVQRFVINLIVARLLVPEDFGLAALLNVVLAGLNLFSDVGIGPALIQNKRGEDERFLRTAFTIQAGRGVLLFLGGCALGYPLSLFYGEPRLVYLIPLVASTGLIDGFRSTSYFRLQRHMQIRTLTLLEVGRAAVSAVVMLVWAWKFPSVYALIAPVIVGTFFDAIVTHFLMRDRFDRFGWDKEAARQLFGFGRWIFISTALTFGASSLDRLVLPNLMPWDEVGVYQIALMLATLPTIALLSLSQRVVFPALSRVAAGIDPASPSSESRESFTNAFMRVRRIVLTLGGFAAAGMFAAGPALVRVAYPADFAEAGMIVQWLAIAGWFHLLEAANGSAMLAQGQPRWTAFSTGAKVVLLFIGVPLAAGPLGYGLVGAAVAIAIADVGRYGASLVGSARLTVAVSPFRMDASFALLAAVSGFGTFALTTTLFESDGIRFLVGSGIVCVLWALPARKVLKDIRS